MTDDAPDVLARLRKLEQGLQAERERIRAAAAGEVLQLQAALRETAARAAQRERELQGLRAQLQRASGGSRLRRRRSNVDSGQQAAFLRERQQLEERARALAETEQRQRQTRAELEAETVRLAAEGADGEHELLSELRAAEMRIAELEQLLREHGETKAALDAARAQLLDREAEISQREIEVSLVRRRIGEEERRLQERAWRTGSLQRRERGAVPPRATGELTFSEGWRRLAREPDAEPPEQPDWEGGNW